MACQWTGCERPEHDHWHGDHPLAGSARRRGMVLLMNASPGDQIDEDRERAAQLRGAQRAMQALPTSHALMTERVA